MNAFFSRVKRVLNRPNGDDASEEVDLNTQTKPMTRASVNTPNDNAPEIVDLNSQANSQAERTSRESAAPEEVDLNVQAERTSRSTVNVRQLTPTQRAGMQLAIGVGVVIALVTLLEVASYLFNGPAIPSNLPDDPDTAKAMIENHKAVSEIYMAQALKVFDVVISGGLLPIFTAILGYIFGTQTAAQSDEGS